MRNAMSEAADFIKLPRLAFIDIHSPFFPPTAPISLNQVPEDTSVIRGDFIIHLNDLQHRVLLRKVEAKKLLVPRQLGPTLSGVCDVAPSTTVVLGALQDTLNRLGIDNTQIKTIEAELV